MPLSRSLLVLHDEDDLACAEADSSHALSGDVLAFDTDIHLMLQDRGTDHLTPWDLIGRDEGPRLRAYEAAVWQHWEAHARIEFEGLDLLGIAAYRHVSALARLAWAAYALRRALEQLRPTRVLAFDEPPAHGLDQPPEYRRMPLLSGVLRWLAERAGCPVRLLSRHVLTDGGAFEDQIARRNRRAYPPIDADGAIGHGPFVLFHGNNVEIKRQLPLIRAIRRETDCAVVQLYKDAPPEVVRQAAECGHLIWHESQVAAAAPVPEVATLAASAREAFNAAGRVAPEALRALFANPYVASHFDFVFGEYAAKMAEHVRAWKDFFGRRRPRAFVANHHAPIYDVAAAVGIPCLGLPHGLMLMGRTNRFTTLPQASLVGAISELHCDRLVQAGISPERIHVTGDPWGDQLLAEARNRRSDPTGAWRLRERFGLAPDRRIVLLCTGSFGMPSKTTHVPMIDWADGVRCMRDLADVIRRRGDWAVLVKCHPRFDYPALYAGVNRTLPADRQLIVLPDEPLGPLAQAADAICIWCTQTAALVEASLVGRPVMQFARNLIWYDPGEWATDAWPHVYDLEAFEAELDRLFSDPQHYARRVERTRQAVRRFLGETDGTAVARCLRVLRPFIGSPDRTPIAAG